MSPSEAVKVSSDCRDQALGFVSTTKAKIIKPQEETSVFF
jgi:hypothetical protein